VKKFPSAEEIESFPLLKQNPERAFGERIILRFAEARRFLR
jgi:hypothetical protein